MYGLSLQGVINIIVFNNIYKIRLINIYKHDLQWYIFVCAAADLLDKISSHIDVLPKPFVPTTNTIVL